MIKKKYRNTEGDFFVEVRWNRIKLKPKVGLLAHFCHQKSPFLALSAARVLPGPSRLTPPSHHHQNDHGADHQRQVQQIQGHTEARQEQGGGDSGDAPGPGQQEQQGVVERGEDESRERQHESEERGGEPGVQRQRGQ